MRWARARASEAVAGRCLPCELSGRSPRQIGLPSRRQKRPSAQRGKGSPGYHLPWPKCSMPPGPKRVFKRSIKSRDSNGLVGPEASVFHSGASKSSIETKGGLAAHGQPHVLALQIGLDPHPQPVEGGPFGVFKRLGDADGVDQPLDRHLEFEVARRSAGHAGDRRGGAVVGRGGQGQVAFAAQQARGHVEADPARAGQIDFRPGMQVGEVGLGSLGSVDGIDIGLELDQIARHEAGGEAHPPHHLHQQPGAVAARSGAQLQGLIGRLDPRLHPHEVAGPLLKVRVHADQKVDRAHAVRLQLGDRGLEQRSIVIDVHIGRQVGLQIVGIGEGQDLRIGLDEKSRRD